MQTNAERHNAVIASARDQGICKPVTGNTKRGKPKEHTNWVITVWKNPREFGEACRKAIEEGEWLRYCVGQVERAPTTGKEHFQGYLQCTRSMSMGSISTRLSGFGIHLELRHGTHKQARDYCRKEETRVSEPIEIGTPITKGQGQRTDLEQVTDRLSTGESILDVGTEHPTTYVKYHKGLHALINLQEEKKIRDGKMPKRAVKVETFWGPPGYGKSRRAMYENPDHYVLSHQGGSNTIWFDGYYGQQTLIIDEFNGQIPYRYFLQLIDPHPTMQWVQIKHGRAIPQWTKVIITTNVNPDIWYKEEVTGGYEGSALQRRIETEGIIRYFSSRWNPPAIEPPTPTLAQEMPLIEDYDGPTFEFMDLLNDFNDQE